MLEQIVAGSSAGGVGCRENSVDVGSSGGVELAFIIKDRLAVDGVRGLSESEIDEVGLEKASAGSPTSSLVGLV